VHPDFALNEFNLIFAQLSELLTQVTLTSSPHTVVAPQLLIVVPFVVIIDDNWFLVVLKGDEVRKEMKIWNPRGQPHSFVPSSWVSTLTYWRSLEGL